MRPLTQILLIVLLAGALGARPGHARGPMHGPLPADQRELIHAMAAANDELTREVAFTDVGYTARTTSENPEIAAMLQKHVSYMQKRVGSGAMVRRWDPAFEEMFRYHDDMTVAVTEIDGGLEAHVMGTTPEAILVAHNHARIISDFVSRGLPAVQSEHPPVVPGEDAGDHPEQ